MTKRLEIVEEPDIFCCSPKIRPVQLFCCPVRESILIIGVFSVNDMHGADHIVERPRILHTLPSVLLSGAAVPVHAGIDIDSVGYFSSCSSRIFAAYAGVSSWNSPVL